MGIDKKNRILTLIDKAEIRDGLAFPAGFQFQIIQGMVYSNGFPIQNEMQSVLKKWLDDNPTLFNITLNY